MTDQSRTRMKVAGLVAVTGGIVLLLSILTVRSILLTQVDRAANQAILDEVQEFIAYVDGAQQIGNGEGEQFDSEADLMRGFLARQTPETHEMLVAVSGEETMFLDNAQNGIGQRFVEDSPDFATIRAAETASGVQESAGFGEIRWGKVTTDQDGAFLVLHFTTPAEAEAAGTVWTFTWVSALSLLLVSTTAWSAVGLVQQIRGRSEDDESEDTAQPSAAPARPMPDHSGDPTVPLSDLFGEPESAYPRPQGITQVDLAAQPGTLEEEHPDPGGETLNGLEKDLFEEGTRDQDRPSALRPIPAASLMLHLQHELQRLHPDRRFILALEGEQHDPGHTADVLGALAQIEGEFNADAVKSEFLRVASSALEHAEPDTTVILGAGRRTSGDGREELRLSASAGSPETHSMSVPLAPQQDEQEEEPRAADENEAPSSHAVVYSIR